MHPNYELVCAYVARRFDTDFNKIVKILPNIPISETYVLLLLIGRARSCVPDSTGSGQSPVAVPCEQGNESTRFMKGGEFLYRRSDSRSFLKKTAVLGHGSTERDSIGSFKFISIRQVCLLSRLMIQRDNVGLCTRDNYKVR